MMRAQVFAAAIAGVIAAPAAAAQAPTSPTLSGNVALVGDYRFRGLSQTYTQPAIQGGVDYATASGAYVGAWGSNVSGNQFLNGGSLELDLYGGYRWTGGGGKVGLDLGLLYYWYPRARYNINPGDRYNTAEVFLGARYDQFTVKYSHALTNLFGMKTSTIGGYCGIDADGTPATTNCLGTGASKGSGYIDLSATFNVPLGASLALHYGHQSVRSYDRLSYADYKVGLTRAFGGTTLGAAWVGTDAEGRFYRFTPTTAGSGETENVARSAIVLSASKAF
ncbi:MAG TPA: TorF family putative porin [Gemmatimonadales bacterium]|nr:TorF family putative porin [Gemmatimonadales bacterium]